MNLDKSQKALLKKAAKNLNISNIDNFYIGNIKNFNDAYYWIAKNIIKNSNIKKIAYPNNTNNIELKNPYDLNKWLDIVYKIYSANKTKDIPIPSLLEQAYVFFEKNDEEYINFKTWFKYYYDGENLKYSSKEDSMKKKALYTGNLQNTSNYSHNTYDLPGSSFSSVSRSAIEDSASSLKPEIDDSSSLKDWKRKVNTALRRIDQLLRTSDHISPDDFLSLSKLLLDFSDKIKRVQLISTAEDLTYQFSNSLLKYAKKNNNNIVKTASEILFKTAQDASQTPPAAQAQPDNQDVQEASPPAANAAGQQGATTVQSDTPTAATGDQSISVPGPDDVDPADVTKIKPIPGAKDGEYDSIMGDINLDDAASKLDEVAGMLSDRRIIRLLAEFDIMLDKIGIAAMFPELAEAQSKLIDGYSYALTRVTKMMGQLANARMLLESQDSGQELNESESASANPEVPKQKENFVE
jgi:hypothetical protein